MTLATMLEAVFCPGRHKERQRLDRLLDETAEAVGAQRLTPDRPLADVVRDVARDMGMPADRSADLRLVAHPPRV